MEKDIRLYYYENGTLKKASPSKLHYHKSVAECLILLARLRKQKTVYQEQYVIVEYTGSYSSRIIYIDPIDIASIL